MLLIYCQVYEEYDHHGLPYERKIVLCNIFSDISLIKPVEKKDIHEYNNYGKSLRIIFFNEKEQRDEWERELYWNSEEMIWDNLYKPFVDGSNSNGYRRSFEDY